MFSLIFLSIYLFIDNILLKVYREIVRKDRTLYKNNKER